MIEMMVDEGVTAPLSDAELAHIVSCASSVAGCGEDVSFCLRFSTDEEVKVLNAQWRDKDTVTDVLSFPMQDDEPDTDEWLGDVILAFPFVAQEAERLGVAVTSHVAHLVIHGTLHLLGYDHVDDDEAIEMQDLENRAMHQLGLHMPYPELTKEENR